MSIDKIFNQLIDLNIRIESLLNIKDIPQDVANRIHETLLTGLAQKKQELGQFEAHVKKEGDNLTLIFIEKLQIMQDQIEQKLLQHRVPEAVY